MIAVLDSGIFMNMEKLPEFLKSTPGMFFYMPNSVIGELKSEMAKTTFALSSVHIQGMSPERKYVQQVQKKTREIGQKKLSDYDIDVLALALMLGERDEVVIYSDDYGVRNVAHALQLESRGVKTSGGKKLRKYYYICVACKSRFDEAVDECDICGHAKFHRRY